MSSQKKRRASAAPAPPAGPAPLLVVSFAGKGGIGKTTQSHLIASGLVRKGHTVLMIDADRQGNLTTVNAQRQVVTLEESAAEEEESVIVKAHAATGEEKKDAEPPKRAEQKAAEKMKDLTEATFFHALETGPGIDLYNMYDATTASLASGELGWVVMRELRCSCCSTPHAAASPTACARADAPSMSMRQLLGGATPADVHTCWQDLMQPMPPSVKRMKAKLRRAIVRVPQGGDGDGEGDGEGDGDRAKLWLLRGSSSLGDLAIALHQHHQGASLNITPHSLQVSNRVRVCVYAWRRMVHYGAWRVSTCAGDGRVSPHGAAGSGYCGRGRGDCRRGPE